MKLKIGLATMLMLSAFGTQAAFTKTDWKTAGDLMVIQDSNTKLEWLNLMATDGKSINQVNSELSTTYSGWRLPTNDEVSALMYGIYSKATTLEWSTNIARRTKPTVWEGANLFATLMGNGAKTLTYHLGLYFDEDGIVRNTGAYVNEGGAYTVTRGLEHTDVDLTSTVITLNGVGGVFLVRGGEPVVPEPEPNPVPSPLGLGLLSLLGVALTSRRRIN